MPAKEYAIATDRPNFLILMADQLAAGALAAYGNRVSRTPHIDELAANGVVFDSFYCNSPLCAPSRFSFLSGRQVSAIGAYDNAAEFRADVPTFAHYLRRGGYRTVLSGKMHFCGADQLHGFEERLTTDIYPADFGWTPDWSRFDERPSWYHSMDSVTQAGPCTRSNQIDFDDEVIFCARQQLFDMARSDDQRPFCMVASMTHPHDPYVIPQRYWDRYADSDIDMPRVQAAVPEEWDPHSRRLRHISGLERQPVTPAQTRAARHAYYGALSYVDEQVGVMLDALRDAGFADDTVVVLLADHGDMLGERGLWYKMNFFEPSCRIPLIVHAPSRFPARRVARSQSLVDLLPTLCELAGGGAPYATPLDGTSLVPLLEGSGDGGAHTGEVIGEYLAEGALAPLVMIKRGPYKFVHSPADPDQLYDLSADPDELRNLASSPAHAARVREFRTVVNRRWDLPALTAAVLASQQRRLAAYAALRCGRYTPWDFQPRRDASRRYVRNDQELGDFESMARFPPFGGKTPGAGA
jgi:choline-sulfatase